MASTQKNLILWICIGVTWFADSCYMFFLGFQTSPLRAWNDDNQPFVVFLVSSGSHFEFVSLLFFQNKLKSLNSSKSIAIWETLYLGQRSQLLGVWYAYSFYFWQVQRPALEVFIYIYISFFISIRYTVLFLLVLYFPGVSNLFL